MKGFRSAWLLALSVSAGVAQVGFAQESGPAAETLLEHSEVESILEGFRPTIEGFVTALGVEVTPRMTEVLDAHLSVDALLPVMRARFLAQGSPEEFESAAALVEDGAIARVEEFVDTIDLAMPLAEYVQAVDADPPPDTRIRLVASIVQAQAAGEFFLLLTERQREAATLIAASMLEGVGPYEVPSAEAQTQQAEQYFYGALYGFLQRYEAVPDSELQAVLADWQSAAGSWYVRAYSLALGETALVAAELVVSALD